MLFPEVFYSLSYKLDFLLGDHTKNIAVLKLSRLRVSNEPEVIVRI